MTVIGYEITRVWCRACAPEGVVDGGNEVMAGADFGVPFSCDDCGAVLAPCSHEWSEWRPWYSGGEFRICDKPGCGETENRDAPALSREQSPGTDATTGERSSDG